VFFRFFGICFSFFCWIIFTFRWSFKYCSLLNEEVGDTLKDLNSGIVWKHYKKLINSKSENKDAIWFPLITYSDVAKVYQHHGRSLHPFYVIPAGLPYELRCKEKYSFLNGFIPSDSGSLKSSKYKW